MFAELIRRKFGVERSGGSDAAFESTTVSLSTGVPRPAERRGDERLSAMLRVGKLTDAAGNEQLIKVKSLSAGGVMAIVTRAPVAGEQVSIELSSQRIQDPVGWPPERRLTKPAERSYFRSWQSPRSGTMADQVAGLAGGCFWCTEAVFLDVVGVKSVESGYTGGTVANPTYRQVCGGDTGHAEAIRVAFGPDQISYDDLLDIFFATHD